MKGSLRQRSPGSWELTVDLGRDERGRRERTFRTVRGTKAQAQRTLREMLSALDRGAPIPGHHILLRDWLASWMRDIIAPRSRQKTKERYDGIIRHHINPALGHVEIGSLAPSRVAEFEAELLGGGMAPKGVSLVHTVLSGAMKHALRMELIHRNPVSLVPAPSVPRRETVPPEISTVRRVLELAEREDHHLYPCIRLIAYTGLRRGEALGLTWANVDLDAGYIQVVVALVRSQELGLIIQPPKTVAGHRRVDLDVGTSDLLRHHRDQQEGVKEAMRQSYDDRGVVFANHYGGWLNPAMLTRAVRSLGRRVGHDGMTVRSLRHFHASVVLQAGQNVVVVSKRLGHSAVSITTDVYAHVLPGWQRQAADAFAEAMQE